MKRHFLAPEEQGRFSQARLDVVHAMAALARQEQCKFVVVAGDVFESARGDRQIAIRALAAMADFDVPVYLLPGNHDPIGVGSVFTSPVFKEHCPPNVTVLADDGPIEVPGCAAEIVGAPWSTKHPLEDLVARASRELQPSAVPRILVGHGAMDAGSPDPTLPALIRLTDAERALADGRLAYIALGDRHSTTNVGSTGRIWYSGAPLATDYDELDPNNCLIVDVTPDSVEVTPQRVGTWQFLRRHIPVNDEQDVGALAAWFREISDPRCTIVKLSFEGTVSLATKAHLDELLEHHRELFAALEVWERHDDLAVLPQDGDFDGIGLSGFAAAALAELRSDAAGGSKDAATAQDALGLLYRLSRSQR